MATLPQANLAEKPVPLNWGITEERIRAKVNELVEVYQPLRVIAFGSWARGEARPDSDLDLAVILDDSAESKTDRFGDGTHEPIPMSVDVIVEKKARHRRLALAIGSVHYDIANEGVVLYRREAGGEPAPFYSTPTEEELLLSKSESIGAVLKLAYEDESMLNMAGVPTQIAAFHGQQALEKLIKAWFAAVDVKPPRVHDLEHLAKTLEEHGLDLSALPINLTEVTRYATTWRYYAMPEAEHLDLNPLRRSVKLLREHVAAQIAARGIELPSS